MNRITALVCNSEDREIILSVLDNIVERQTLIHGDLKPGAREVLKQNSIPFTRYIKPPRNSFEPRTFLVATVQNKQAFLEELDYQNDIYIDHWISDCKTVLCCDGPCDSPFIEKQEPYSLKHALKGHGCFQVCLHPYVNAKCFAQRLTQSLIVVDKIEASTVYIETSTCSDLRPLLDERQVRTIKKTIVKL